MDYERIHKVQTGIISPSKLRIKLIGSHHNKKKDGSNSNSARTSPSKLEDSEFVKNSLLACKNAELEEEVAVATTMEVKPEKAPDQSNQVPGHSKEENVGRVKIQHHAKGDSSNSSAIHPLRIMEDDNLDYDSNASSSSFEFHKGERAGHHAVTRSSLSQTRPMPSKWNDAEKWIMSRPNQYQKKNVLQNQTNRMAAPNMVKVAPEHGSYDHNKLPANRAVDTKRVDFCQPVPQMGLERLSYLASGQAYGGTMLMDTSSQTRDLREVVLADLPCTRGAAEDSAGIPTVREVSMRDMGTEMTPVASQEPSRTATPMGSATPIRSPTSSVPSTPRRGVPAPTPLDNTTDEDSNRLAECSKKELSEEELKLKTRQEIVALGVQLGKMNIAAWASKDEAEKSKPSPGTGNTEELERIEFGKRAAAWEEVEKSKHTARYKREEINIQAWESQQKVKLEAEMRRIEAQVEQMRAQAQAKMVKKIALTRQRSEEKRAAAEARKNREAERTAAQTEYIRQTGRLPSSRNICCGWL